LLSLQTQPKTNRQKCCALNESSICKLQFERKCTTVIDKNKIEGNLEQYNIMPSTYVSQCEGVMIQPQLI